MKEASQYLNDKSVRMLQSMAKRLDIACEKGEIDTDELENFQKVLNHINDLASGDNRLEDPHAYLIFEVQALIFWMRSDDDSTCEFLESAIIAKGDQNLHTQSARNLINTLQLVIAKPWYKKSISAKTMWALTLVSLFVSPLLFLAFLIIAIILSVRALNAKYKA